MSTIPDQVSACGRCGELFADGGGVVSLITFAPLTVAPAPWITQALCPPCYRTVYGLVVNFLYSVGEQTG